MWQLAHPRSVAKKAALLLTVSAAALAGWGRVSREAQAGQGLPENDPSNLHTITVLFDYDFGKNPPCTKNPAVKMCVKQFDVYDVSGQRFRLFSMPVPKDATGFVRGIKGQSPPRILLPGTHFIAVTAENALGLESDVTRIAVHVQTKAATDSAPAPK